MSNNPENLPTLIDQILSHHYFHQKLHDLLQSPSLAPSPSPSLYTDTKQLAGLQDQYYKAEEDVIAQLTDVISSTADLQLRAVLEREFIDVGEEIEGIKREMFVWMDQQAKKMEELRKEVHRLAEEAKRRASTTQAMSNTPVINANGYTGGIRFLRSSVGSSGQTIGASNNGSDGKSFHSELTSLRKQIEELKESLDKGEAVRVVEEQFNQFKIQTKVALEAIKHQAKKMTVQIGSLTKSASSQTLSPALKQSLEQTVKRSITAQLKAYATYSDQLSQLRQEVEKVQDKLAHQGQLHNEYLSNQLKSVWLVLNDMRRTLDQVTENIGLNSSREML